MKIRTLIDYLEKIAPPQFAEAWDTGIGLVCGQFNTEVSQILVALDLDAHTLATCQRKKPDLLILHHPPLFQATQHLVDGIGVNGAIATLIRQNVAVYAMHTNYDAVVGGTAFALAKELGLSGVPATTQPIICTCASGNYGYGWHFALHSNQTTMASLERICHERLGCKDGIRTYTNSPTRTYKQLALFPGSFDRSWISSIATQGVECIVTGEISWDALLLLHDNGVGVITIGHDRSEWPAMRHLASILGSTFPKLTVETTTQISYN